ncbi:MAG TPA: amidohydrolase [Thermoanaerobaculia bacterium]|jgi:predicted amidohydrolase YtcJ|nr:amidohydrolase [Thermoanaerobaculia bacterium]
MLTALVMTVLLAATPPEPPADLVLLSAKIWTGDPSKPEAEALAVRGGRIVAVGMDKDIAAFRGPKTVVLDGKWRRVTPGFIDCHTHMSGGGFDILALDVRHTKDGAEFTRLLAAYAKTRPAGEWLTDGVWDEKWWMPPVLPTRALLDPATGDHPTCLSRQDGHMMVCNSLALKIAGVTAATPDPPGGVIVKDAKGAPAGILKDGAMDLVWKFRPARTAAEIAAALRAAMKESAKYGVTSVQDLPGDASDVPAWDGLRNAGELTVRVNYRPSLSHWEEAKRLQSSLKNDEWLRIGGVKGFMDGSLGSGTAVMFEAFSDEPGNRGVYASEAIPLSALEDRIAAADKAGLQVEVHAIGDRANSEILDIYQRVEKKNGPRDRRFRIEHAQHLRAADIPRFAELGVIASMQPYHAVDDGRWADKRLGAERARTTYAFRTLLDDKATLAFGSDWDVAPISPILGIAAAVTRRTIDGKNPGGWVPEQRITVEEALRAYTVSAAYAGFEEKDKGSLEPGKLADFVILGADPLRVKPEELEKIQVDATVVGGRTVYSR